jgi:hypothetical protein
MITARTMRPEKVRDGLCRVNKNLKADLLNTRKYE